MIPVVVLAVVVALVMLWIRSRRNRAATLSGTVAERPVFQLEPPRRRMHPRKDERL